MCCTFFREPSHFRLTPGSRLDFGWDSLGDDTLKLFSVSPLLFRPRSSGVKSDRRFSKTVGRTRKSCHSKIMKKDAKRVVHFLHPSLSFDSTLGSRLGLGWGQTVSPHLETLFRVRFAFTLGRVGVESVSALFRGNGSHTRELSVENHERPQTVCCTFCIRAIL